MDVEFEHDDLQIAELFANDSILKGNTGSIYISIAKNDEPTNPIILCSMSAT